jgi:dienelactone hydrolase
MKATLLILVLAAVVESPLFAQTVTVFDTVYTPPGDADGDLVATLYIPSESVGVGVVLSHWWTGDRHTMKCWAETLAAHGYVAMAIDYYDFSYRGNECVYPKPVRSFKLAVEFLRRGAEGFGISSGRVVGLGQSEGAIHWGQTIVWDNDDAYFGTDPAIDDRLDAVVLFYGAYDNEHYLSAASLNMDNMLVPYFSPNPESRYTKGNPIANVANITTPVLLYHGMDDAWIPWEQSVEFYRSLVANQKVCEAHIIRGWPHDFDVYEYAPFGFTPQGLIAKDTVLAFLNRHVIVSPTGVAGESVLPSRYVLSQNYPNPFNPSTTIEFALPHAGFVTLTVYNLLGERVSTLVAADHPAGTYEATWDASGLPSGVYFYRLTAEEYVQTKRMIVVK